MKALVALLLSPLLMVFATAASAVEEVVVMALFKDRAVVVIDGTQRMLTAGETSPEGVMLVAADSEAAVLDINGERSSYTLGSHIGGVYAAPALVEVQLWPNRGGMYLTSGVINGIAVDFLVDTGATLVAMNSGQAKRLGVDYRLNGKPAQVSTASGISPAFHVELETVKVGDVQLRNIGAVVIEGNYPEKVLLGMSFLGRLEMRREGNLMVLRKKF